MRRNAITYIFRIGNENVGFIFDRIKSPSSCEEKILGVITDNELKLDRNNRSMCKKAA